MKKKIKRFIDYNYQETYTNDLANISEQFVQSMFDKVSVSGGYATRKIKAGSQIDIEIYPVFKKMEDLPKKIPKENKAQKKLNSKNAKKRLIRLINTNFTSDDIWLTLTYSNSKLPDSIEQAMNNVKNYIRRLNRKRAKEGLDKMKYIYVTEWKENIRCHHHIVMSGDYPMDLAEKEWKLGKRNEVRRLSYDDDGLTGLATYLAKDPIGKKRWCSSINLKQPQETVNYSSFTARKVLKMAKDYGLLEDMIKKKFANYRFKEANVYYNDFNGRFYISCKLVDDSFIKKKRLKE